MGRINRGMEVGRLQQQASAAQDVLDREYRRTYGIDMKEIRARQSGNVGALKRHSAWVRGLRRLGRGGRGAVDAEIARHVSKLLTVKPLFDAAGRAGAIQRQLGNLGKLGRQRATAVEYWLRRRQRAQRDFEKKYDGCTKEACRKRELEKYRRNKWGTRLPKSDGGQMEPGIGR